MIMPDVLIVENYRTLGKIGLLDSIPPIGLPYIASAFGIFLLRQAFKTIPRELDEAARVEGANAMQILWKVYVPLARPGVSRLRPREREFPLEQLPVAAHRHELGRPRAPSPSGLQVFSSGDQGVDWSVITAATLMTSAPLLVAFLLFQRQFVQSFMRAGIR